MCLTTEEAKAVYECLNQDQVVSPIHFNKELPKLHSIREAAYAKLEHILEEEGPLNPYEHCTVSLSLFAGLERILRRFSIFAEEPCKSTITTTEPCSPVFKEAQPRPSNTHNQSISFSQAISQV